MGVTYSTCPQCGDTFADVSRRLERCFNQSCSNSFCCEDCLSEHGNFTLVGWDEENDRFITFPTDKEGYFIKDGYEGEDGWICGDCAGTKAYFDDAFKWLCEKNNLDYEIVFQEYKNTLNPKIQLFLWKQEK